MARSAAQSLGPDCHLGLLSESLSRLFILNPWLCTFSRLEFSCPVLFSIAFKIPAQKSVLGKDVLRE